MIAVVFSRFFAFRNTSCKTPPAGIVVGSIPVNVIGFVVDCTSVIFAVANAVGSAADHTTTNTVGAAVDALDPLETGLVSLGKVAGAVNTPWEDMLPQFGLHDAPFGSATSPSGKYFVLFATGCITAHWGFALPGDTFRKDAVNCTCCAGLNPTGTVAVAGVALTAMPELSEMTAVPFLFFAASAVAVNVSVGGGEGKFESVGDVYVSTLFVDDGAVVHVPRLPLFSAGTFWPDVHVPPFTCEGFGVCVVGNGVYTNVQAHVEVVVVEPATVAVKVDTVPAITVAIGGNTVTVTVFAPEPPQPLCKVNAAASISIAAVCILTNFITPISLTFSPLVTTSVRLFKSLIFP